MRHCTRFLSLLILMLPATVLAETIVLRSGEGTIGTTDPTFHFWANSPFLPILGLPLASTHFEMALAGEFAHIVAPQANTWLGSLTCDPQAQWISPSPSRIAASTLFAAEFDVASCCIEQATLTFCWAADDQLGDLGADGPVPGGNNPSGVYINQLAVTPTIAGGDYLTESSVDALDITAMLQCGTNTFFVYNRDAGALVSGAIFRATIEITECPVPNERRSWSQIKGVFR